LSNDGAPSLRTVGAARADDSPISKRMRRAWKETQQQEAFKDLLTLRGANGGKLNLKDIKDLVNKYKQKGYTAVSRDNLYYQLRCYKTVASTNTDRSLSGTNIITAMERQLTMSDLMETSSPLNVTNLNDIRNITGSSEPNDNINSIITTKKGGRPKEVTKAADEKKDAIVKESLTKAAILYEEACKEARKSGKNAVPKGTLERMFQVLKQKQG
jgi:hypothetical protein